MKIKLKKIINFIIFFIILILLYLSIYIKLEFFDVSFEQLIYSTFTSQGTSSNVIIKGATFVFTGVIVTILLVIVLKLIFKKYLMERIKKFHIYLTFKYKTKTRKILLFKNTKLCRTIIFIALILILLITSLKLIKVDVYIKGQFNKSYIFDDYYVDARDIKIEFPEKKRNLIYIYIESLEMTNAATKNGGALEASYIPNLEQLALDEKNINFSNTSKLGGALQLTGSSWTAAALISQTAGIPLKISIDSNSYQNYGESFPGIYNLGDILKANGYKNYFLLGSKAEFGGRKDYFTYHGKYDIYDYNYALDNKWIDKDYHVWWGYEDKKLYQFAKDTLLEISKNDEPFNYTILTADTHFTDGYLDETCEKVFDKQYPNTFYCADKMLNEFLNWVKEQDFYEDTTIIIVGDHLTMQQNFYNNINKDYNRNIYDVVINSSVEASNSKNRIFTSLDMFPTTLASLGVKIEGDRIGLGTNLFSDKKTLAEELGFDYLDKELRKKSFFYDNYLLGDSYYKMQKYSYVMPYD